MRKGLPKLVTTQSTEGTRKYENERSMVMKNSASWSMPLHGLRVWSHDLLGGAMVMTSTCSVCPFSPSDSGVGVDTTTRL